MKNTNKKIQIFPIVGWLLATLWVVIFVTFLLWMGITSLKDPVDFWTNPFGLPSPKHGWQFENYVRAFNSIEVTRKIGDKLVHFNALNMIGHSVIYALGKSICSLIPPCLVSYLIAKYNYIPFVAALWAVVLLYRYVPISASTAACIEYMNFLGLYDKMWGIFIWSMAGFGGDFLLLYATWRGVSTDYRDAAFIDGAGHFRAMLTVMFPMIYSLIFILFVQSFIAVWNDYMGPMVYLPSSPTLAYGAWLFQFANTDGVSDTTGQMAGLYMLSLPMFIVFLCVRKKIMNASIGITGLKG